MSVDALRRAVDETAHLVPEARLGHVARALAVDLPVLALRQVDLPEGGREVEDDVGPGDQPVDERLVGHAAERDLRAKALELVVEQPGGGVENAHLIAPRRGGAGRGGSR